MGVSGQRHTPTAIYPGERTPGTHCTGGWVGLRAGPDTEKNPLPCRGSNPDRPVVQSVVRHYTDWATLAPTCPMEYKVKSNDIKDLHKPDEPFMAER
jgi:hypothetical protein